MARSPVAEPAREAGAMVPIPYRVVRRRRETHDSWTLELEPHGGASVQPFAPGQFAMLYAFGKGEIPISVSALPLVHTIRAVGVVSAALCDARKGDVLGVRGPFGTAWPIEAAEGADVVVLTGGIGLAPLRPVVHHLLANRERYGRVVVLSGGRSPEELLYTAELERWRGRFDIQVEVAVDQAGVGWRGRVGVVTTLVPRADFDPAHTVAMICGPEVMMRFAVAALQDRGGAGRGDPRVARAQHEVCDPAVRSLPARARVHLPRRPRVPLGPRRAAAARTGALDGPPPEARRLEVRLLRRLPAERARLRGRAARARRRGRPRLLPRGLERAGRRPYDLSLVEGSITTPEDAERIQRVRRQSRRVVTIGACATAGGIQALRNFADVEDFLAAVYASPEYVSTLASSTAISEHVHVDYELHGCPVDKLQLLEVISAFLNERRPAIASHSVCVECKRAGNVCVMVAHGTPCLGPVTHAGCGALCPSYHRGCYGCFGPMETPRPEALSPWLAGLGMQEVDLVRVYRTFNATDEPFRTESEAHE